MIRAATLADLPAIRQLLTSSSDAPYDVAAVAEEKCFGAGFEGEPATFVTTDLDAVAVICGRYLRLLCVRRDRRRQGIGSAIVNELKPQIIAAEPGNYFVPGVQEHDAGFFAKLGYRETAQTWNLHVDVGAGQANLPVPLEGDWTGRLACPPQNAALLDFIRTNFGQIWAFEAARALTSFYAEGSGFAVIEANNRGLGTFGPTGVAESMRGRGLGKQLLLASLGELRRLGHSRAVIPWTDSLDFYRRSCGAHPAHRFVTYTSRP